MPIAGGYQKKENPDFTKRYEKGTSGNRWGRPKDMEKILDENQKIRLAAKVTNLVEDLVDSLLYDLANNQMNMKDRSTLLQYLVQYTMPKLKETSTEISFGAPVIEEEYV